MSRIVVPLCALGIASCAPTESTNDQSPLGQNSASFGARPHYMPLASGDGAVEKPGSAQGTPDAKYYGGPVISNVNVYAVFWNSSVNYQSQIPGFYQTITNSTYFDWLSEYDTPTQDIGRGTFAGSVVDTGAPTGKTIDDTQIQAEVARLINAGILPNNSTGNNLYMMYFPPGVTITSSGSSSCQQFCAYHSTYQSGSQYVYYGVIPDMGGGCASGCGASNQLGNTTSVSSHEMIEAVTDGAVGLATSYASPLAWYDQTNGEIADICNAQQDTVDGYTVQLIWSNKQGACVDSPASGGTTTGSTATAGATTSSSSSRSSTSGSTSSTRSSSSSSSRSSTSGTTGGTAGTTATTTGTTGAGSTSGTTTGTTGATGGTGTNLLANGNFETGTFADWTATGTPKPTVEKTVVFDGKYSAKLGDDASAGQREASGDSYIYQLVALPSSAAHATLSFAYHAVTKGTDASDSQSVQLYDSSGNYLTTVWQVAENDGSGKWNAESLSLDAYLGQSIYVLFDVHQQGGTGDPTGLYVDDVEVTAE